MKNVEKADRVHLGSLIDSLKKGHYVIPDFQRDFEWEPWDVRELIRSIFMDYYIGTLLLWKGNDANYKMLSCEPIYGFKDDLDAQHIVFKKTINTIDKLVFFMPFYVFFFRQ